MNKSLDNIFNNEILYIFNKNVLIKINILIGLYNLITVQ